MLAYQLRARHSSYTGGDMNPMFTANAALALNNAGDGEPGQSEAARFQLAALQREVATLKAENERLRLVRSTAMPACCITPLTCFTSLRSDTIDHSLSLTMSQPNQAMRCHPRSVSLAKSLSASSAKPAGLGGVQSRHPVAANAPRAGDSARRSPGPL